MRVSSIYINLSKVFVSLSVILLPTLSFAQTFPDLQWANNIQSNNGTNQRALDIATFEESLYVIGWFGDTADYDPGPGVYEMTSSPTHDHYLARFDTLGNFNWVKE